MSVAVLSVMTLPTSIEVDTTRRFRIIVQDDGLKLSAQTNIITNALNVQNVSI